MDATCAGLVTDLIFTCASIRLDVNQNDRQTSTDPRYRDSVTLLSVRVEWCERGSNLAGDITSNDHNVL